MFYNIYLKQQHDSHRSAPFQSACNICHIWGWTPHLYYIRPPAYREVILPYFGLTYCVPSDITTTLFGVSIYTKNIRQNAACTGMFFFANVRVLFLVVFSNSFWLAVHGKPVLFWKGISGLKFPCFLFYACVVALMEIGSSRVLGDSDIIT